ncbi:TPA: hypothetical protein ACGFFS_001811 [Campylobacter coli]|uniref:hypothetical protein n=1 Tax=Campylobacter coli TaxID=195 RepID=UPI0013881828|nr:hypothetical protein [Campylobacter coli]ECR2457532.1 hypothetical protein [Campylobacter jejuni]MBX0490588.1 hypothetical protein [Campylobacter jejuni]MBX0622307.1 hypothetical protein [Campylobacter jejuni]MBX0634478.1 hypothetical protein [Campylobacter jejuni]MBX0702399.1 hypothetical protein [Campylobacter jejuni]
MKKRRADLLKKQNSKIVLADTLESEAMVDLAMKANDIFLKLKKTAGVGLDFKDADEMLMLWNLVLVKSSQTLEQISQKIDMKYDEPFTITLAREKLEK